MGAIALVGLSMSCGGGRGGNTDADGNSIGVGLKVRVVSGNKQTAKKATAFALPLVARVESPAGDPVPEMEVECKQISSTDGYITGPTKFKTDTSGLISTTAFSPSSYDVELVILCELPGTPNGAKFTLESAFVVDHVEWVVAPSSPYTADATSSMVTFQARIMDDTNTVIDVSNTKHWLDLTVTTAGNPALLGTTRQYFTNGVATFTDIKHLKANAITLRAAYNRNPAKYIEQTITVDPNVTTQSIAILPGQTYTSGVTTLAAAVTGTPTAQTTDTNFNVEVRATDAYFNTTLDASAVSVITPTDLTDTEPAASSFVAGVQSFNISPVQAKSGSMVRPVTAFTDNDSTIITIGTGAPTHLIAVMPGQTFNAGQTSLASAITGAPTAQTAGVSFAVGVRATDAEYNIVSTTPIVALATNDAADTEPAAGALVAGQRTFNVTNITSGTARTVTPSAAGYTSNASTNFTVYNNVATKIVLMNQPSPTTTAGDEIPLIVQIQDVYNNIVTNGVDATANVALTLFSGTGTLGGTSSKPAVAGVADFTGDGVYANLIGTKVIRVTKALTAGSAQMTLNTNSFNVVHAPASQFVVANPTDANVGDTVTVTVRALDPYTNIDTTYNSDVTLVTDGSATGGGLVNIVNGVGTITISDLTAETVNLTLSDTQGTGLSVASTQNVVFSPGPPVRFVIVNPTDGTAGTAINVTVNALDVYNNVSTTYNTDVTLNADGSATGDGLVDIVNGTGIKAINDTVAETVNLSLTDSQATGLIVTSTQNVVFAPAPATKFIIANPTDGTAGTAITVTVRAYDQYNNLDTNFNTDVTLVVDGSATGGGLINISNGIGTIAVNDTVAEIVNLTLSDTQATGLDITSTQNVAFAAGPVTQFAILNPTDGTAGTAIPVTVEAQDQYGNKNLTYNTDVTLNADGSATGDGLVPITAGTGFRNINDLVAETVNLSLTDSQGTGKTVTSTQDVVFAPGAATKFVIVNPTDGTAGTAITVTVRALDANNNIDTAYNTDVTLVADGSATGDGLVDIVAGVGTIAVNDLVAETVNLSLSDSQTTGLNVTSTQNVIFAPGAVTKFAILNPTDGTAGTAITVTVQAQDQYGNMNPAYNTDVTLVADGSATGDGLVNINAGTGTRSINDLVAETVNLSLSDTLVTGLDVTSTQNVVFAPGIATKFVIVNPTDGTAGTAITVTVQAQDVNNNIATAYNSDVTLNADGSATGDGLVDIVAGVGTIAINDLVAETVNLSLSDSQATGKNVTSTQNVVFAPGPATQFVIVNPTDGVAGTAVTVTVRALDANNNIDTAYNTDVTLVADGSATGDGLVNIASGVGTLAVNDLVAETVNLSLTDSQATGLTVTSTQNVVFGPAPATQFIIVNPTDGTAGTAITVTVRALDANNNIDTAYNTDVTLVADGAATGDGLVNIVAGVGTIAINDLVAQTVNLSLTDSQGTGLTVTSTQDVVFAPGAASQFVIVNPTDGTAGTAITVTVRALDANNNIDTAYGTDVTLVADGSATGDGLVDIVNGVGTLAINDLVAETVNLSLSDSQTTGLTVTSTQNVVFSAGPVTKFVILNPTDTTVGNASTVTVQAQDVNNNVNLTYGTDVTLVADGSATGDGLVNIVNGVGTLAINDLVAETVNLILSDSQATGHNVASTQNLVFSPGTPVKFVILNPTDGTAGTAITVTVQVQDANNNVVTTYGTDVTLNADGSATGDGLVDIVNGVGTLAINDLVAETVNLSLTDSQTTGLTVTSTQNVLFAPGAATQFVIVNPTDGTAGTAITVTVRALDANNNIDTAYGTDVTLVADGSATGDGLVNIVAGVGTLAVNDLVAETVNLSLSDSQVTGLTVTSTQNVVFAPGAATQFFIVNPTDGTAGTAITVTVRALDANNNIDTAYNTDVTLVADGSATGDGLVNIVAGVGTLAINDLVAETVNLSLSDSQTTGLTVTSTQNVVFAPGAATKFVILNPTDGTAGTAITVTVQAQDVNNNVATAYNTDVTLVVDGSATGAGLVNIAAGTGSLNINDTVAEVVNLSLSDSQGTGLNVTSTQNVLFGPGAASQFVIINPTDGTAGTAITVTVRALDANNNIDTAYGTDVTLVADGSATGDGLVNIVAGVGTLAVNDLVAETVNLSLSDSQATGLTVTSTQNVVFAPGAATQFVIVNPTDGTAGTAITVTVRALDANNNIDTAYGTDVTLVADGSATGDGLVNIVAGVGTLAVNDLVAETVNLSLSDSQATGLTVTSTQNVVFAPGAATKFVILNPTDNTVGQNVTVTIQAQDVNNNVATAYGTDVTLVADGSATGDGLVNIVAGVGTIVITDLVAETVNLSLSDTQGTGLNVTSTQNVLFSPGTPTKFVITNPTDGTAGTGIVVTVRALDAANNVVTTFQDDVTLVADGSATGDGLVAITNGIGTLTINDLVAQTVNLSLSDSQATGLDVTSTQDVIFAPGAATQFVIVNPTDGTAGTAITVTVRALDANNNIDTAYGTDVTLVADGSATGDGLVNIVAGVGTLAVNDLVAETVNLSLSDSQATGLTVSSTQNVVFAPGAATQFVIVNPTDGTAGTAITVTVRALDVNNNIATAYNTDVTLNADGSSTGAGVVDIVAGVGTKAINDLVAETVNLSLTDSQGTGLTVTSTQNVVFAPGAATKFVILNPTDGTAGTAITVTVQAQDANNNVATAYNTDVTLVTDGSATGAGLVNIAAGTGSLSINDTVAEVVNLSLSDSQGTGLNVTSTQNVLFAPGAATQFVIVNPTDGTAGTAITVTVRALDANNNIDTAYGTDVTLVADGSATGDGLVNIVAGVGTLSINDLVAETVNLSLSDSQTTGLTVTSTQNVLFAPGAATQFVIVNPTDGTAGTAITVTVRALDANNNIDTAYGTDVTLVADGSATGDGLVNIVAGVGTLAVNDLVAETVNLSLSDSQTTGLTVTSTQNVVFAPGAATKFVILNPTDDTVGQNVTVTIQAQDANNNVATAYATDVTLVADGSATGDGLVDIVAGVGTIVITDLIAETVNLSLSDTQATGLNVTSTQNVLFSPGTPTKFVITNPTDGTAGTGIVVTVRALDAANNVVTVFQDDVTLVADGSATGDGLVNIVNGVGTLTINDLVAETVNLSLSDSQATGLDITSTQDVIFAPGAATQFVIVNPTDGTAGTAINVTVRALDANNNIDTAYGTDVTLVADGSATGDGLVNIVAGVGTLSVNDLVAETVNLSLSDSQGTGLTVTSTQNVVFAPGAASKFVILNPTDGTAGTGIVVTVQAQDANGNVDTAYGTDVTLNADGSATGDGVVNIVNGVGTRTINDLVAETVNLSLTDSLTTGRDVTSTQDVIFAPGAATQFVIVNPTDGTAGTAITVTVRALDANNNIATAYNTDVTLVADGSATGDGLVNITAGVGTLAINDLVAETVNLSLSDSQTTGLTVTSTQNVVFAPGAATKFAIVNPTDGTAGTAITVTVRALDANNNIDTAYGTDVTLNADGSATGDGVVDIVAGVGTLAVNDLVAETVNLSLSDSSTTGLDVTSTQNVVFAPGAATQFVIVNPTDGTAGTAITVTVRALDANNNIDTAYATDVTLVADGSATGDGLVNIVAGVGTLAVNDLVAETVNLSLSDSQATGLTVTSTQNVVFAPGAATKFVILNPTDGTAGTAITVTVQAQDANNNVVTSYGTDVTLNADGSATGDGVVDIVAGVGTLAINDLVAETVNLSLTDSSTTGLNVTSTQNVVFAPGAATKFVILDPTDGTAGTAITVTVQAQDANNNVVTSYGTDVTLVTDGSATGGGVVDIVNGVGTKAINDTVAEVVNLSLSDSSTTGLSVTSTQSVTFAPGAATQFVIINPTDGTAGTGIVVTVRALDANNNIATAYGTDVTLVTDGSATGAGLVNIAAGTGTITINDLVAETVNLSLSDTQTTGLNVTSTQDVIFAPGAATKFVIINPTDGTAGTAITVTVQAQDANNNVVTSYGTDVTLNADGSATGDGVVDIVAGVGTLAINDTVAETVNLSLTDSSTTGLNVTSTQNVVFAPGAATKFVIINPTDGTAGTAITVTVQAQDANNNVVTGYGTDVTLNADGSATGDGVVNIVAGIGTLAINDLVAETVNLSLTDSSTTGLNVTSTQNVVFAPGAATKFVILNPTDGTAGTAITVTVQAQDANNNIVTSYGTDVTLNADGSATGDGVVDIVAGVGTLAINDLVAETVNLSLTDSSTTGLTVTSTQNVVFAPGAATKFVIINPTDGTAGTAITVTVQAQDANNNVVTGYGTDVTLAADGGATGGGVVDIVAGVGTRAINTTVAQTVSLSLTDSSATGLNVASTQDVIFAPGAATKFVIINPTDGTAGTAITVTVQAQDANNNVVTSYGTDVTLNADGSATGDGVVDIASGVGTLAINDLVAETVNLSLTDSSGTGLNVTSTQNVVFAPGAATKFVISNPTDGTAGTGIVVTVRALDANNNVVTSYGTDVTLDADGSATGDGVVDIVAGVGTKTINDLVAETVNLSLTDSSTTGLNVTSTQDVIFAPGAATKFVIVNPTDGNAGTPITVTVRALDVNNNIATAYNTDVTLNADGSATGDGLVNITAGVGTLAISNLVAETVNLSLTDSQGTGLNVTSTQDVIFAPAPASKFVIINPTDGTAGTGITVTVQAQDVNNNVVTTYGNDVTLNADGSATGDGVVDIVNGVGTIVINDLVAETVNLSLTDSATTGLTVTSTQNVVFAPGAATKFVIVNPTDGTAGTAITVTVQAQDVNNNIATAYNTDVTLNADGSATGDGLVNITAGVGTLAINDLVAETVNLSLTDSQTTGLNVASTQNVVFAPGAATKFVIINPTDGTAGTAITVTVQAQDANNNIVTSYGTDVTLNADGSATGDGVVDIVAGVGTLAINDLVAETVNLSLTDSSTTGLTVTSTQNVVFAPGAATKFVIINPTDGTAGTAITVTVQAQDANNNVVTSYGTDVTLVTDGSATGGGVVDIVAGVGTKAINDTVAEVVNLSLSDTSTTGLNVASTQNVVFAPGAATKFVIINPTDGTAGTAITVTVQAQDANNNVVTGYGTDVTLNADGSATGDGVVDIVAGIGTLAINDLVAETVNLSLTDSSTTGLNVTSTQNVVFAPGAATKFVIINPTDGTAGTAITVTVQAQDANNNIVTGYGTDVTLNTDGSATGDGVVDIVAGVGTLAINDTVAETVNLSLTDSSTTGLNVTSTQNVVFAPGAATKFVIINPTDGTAGTAITVTVQAQDANNNVVTGYGTDVTLNADGSATGDGVVDIVAGVGTLAINDLVAETVNLSLTDSSTTGLNVTSTQDVIFAPGAATKFVITNPTDGTAGTGIVVTVRALDANNNVVTSYGTDVTLDADGSATGDGVVDIVAGVGTKTINDLVAETVNLSLTDSSTTGLDVSSTQNVVFAPGAATKFVITNPTDGTAGTGIVVTVRALDANNNVVTSYGTDVTLDADGSATGDGVVDIVAGVGTKTINDLVAETVNLSLTDSSTTGLDVTSTQDVIFAPGAATKFVITDPTDGTAGTAITVTVRALDANNNVVTSYGTDVTLNADGSATGDGVVDIVAGVGTLAINDLVAETVNLSLTDSATTGLNVTSTQNVVFAPGAATKFVIINPTDGTAGTAITVTVQAQDANNNVVTSYGTDVTLNADGSATGDGVVNITAGVGTLNINDLVAETVNLSLTDSATSGLNVTSTQDVIFAPGAATKFVISNPTDGTAGTAITVTVRALDANNNVVTSYGTDVTLNADGSATGDGVVDIVAGVGTLNINDLVAETVNLSLTDSSTTGLNVTSTQDVIFAPGAATQYVIVNPTDGTAGTAITVTVRALDANNNIATSQQADVTLNADGSATGDGVVAITNGVGTLNINDLVAETVNLSLTDSSATGLTVTSTQDVIFAPGAATQYVIVNPTDGTAGTAITVTVRALDANNNIATSQQADVTLNADGSATGDGVVAITNGVGTLIINDLVAETVNLSLTDSSTTGLTVTSTQDVIFAPGAATKFVISNPTDGTAGTAITVTVRALDANNNVVTSYGTDVTLNADGSATGDGVVDIVAGVGTLNINDLVAETVNLSLTDSSATGLTVTSTQDVIFAPGAATQYVIVNPTDGTAGTAITVTVRALDVNNNIATSQQADVTLNADGSATGDGVVAITNGVGTLAINDLVAETVNLSLADSSTTGLTVTSTQDVIFAPGAATKFVISNPTDGTAGTAITVTVRALDANNNVVTSYGTDVTLNADGSATGDGVVDIVAGVGTLNINDLVAETVNLSLTDSSTTGLDITSTQDVIFAPGAATQYVIVNPTDGTAGTAITVTVRALDVNNNIATSQQADVTLNADGSATGDGVVAITNGVGTLAINDLVAETVNLSLADSSTTGLTVTSTQDVIFAPGTVTKFVILNPADSIAGTATTVTVQAQDANGNVNPAYATDVTLVASGSVTGEGLVDIVAGVGTLSINDTVAETSTLTLSDSQTTGKNVTSTQDVVFTHAAAATVVFSTQPAASGAGADLLPVVEIRDTYGNRVTTGAGSSQVVTITKTSGTGALFGDNTVAASAGLATWTSTEALNLRTTDSYVLNAAISSPAANVDSSSFAISAGTPSVLAVTGNNEIVRNVCEAYVITRYDAYGNIASPASATTINGISDGTGSGLFYATADTTCVGASSASLATSIASGQSSVTVYYKNAVVEAVTQTATATSFTDGTYAVNIINSCDPDHLHSEVIVAGSATSTIAAEQVFDVRVTAHNASHGTMTCYKNAKTIAWTMNASTVSAYYCGATGPFAPVAPSQTGLNFTNGVATTTSGDAVFYKAETATITANDGTFSGNSSNITVNSNGTTCHAEIRTAASNGGTAPASIAIALNDVQNLYMAGYDKYRNYVGEVTATTWTGTTLVYPTLNPASSTTTSSRATVTGVRVAAAAQTITANAGAGSMTDSLTMTVSTTNPTFTGTATTVYDDGSTNNGTLLAANTTRSVFHWDSTAVAGTWRTDSALSWYNETMVANVRGASRKFPERVHLVSTDSGLSIIDATNNLLWMRFTIGAGNLLDSTLGSITSVRALNSNVYVSMNNGTTAGGVIVLDFKNNRAFQIGTTSYLASNTITNRNAGNNTWSANTTYPTLASNLVWSMDVRRISTVDYLVVGTSLNTSIYQDNGTTITKFNNSVAYTNLSTAVKLTASGKLYVGLDGLGIHTASLALPISANFTTAAAFTTATNPYLIDYNINSIDVTEDTSNVTATENTVSVGTDRGLAVINESSTVASSKVQTYVSAKNTTRGSAFGKFAGFTGAAGSYIQSAALTNTNSRTIEFWFMPTGSVTSKTLFHSGGSGNGIYSLSFDASNQLTLAIKQGTDSLLVHPKTTWTTGLWYFVSVRFNTSGSRSWSINLYDSSVPGWTTAVTTGSPPSTTMPTSLYVGAQDTGAGGFIGYIDEFHVYEGSNQFAFNGGTQALPTASWSNGSPAIDWRFEDAGGRTAACTGAGPCTIAGTLNGQVSFVTGTMGGTSDAVAEVKMTSTGTAAVGAVCTAGAAGGLTRYSGLRDPSTAAVVSAGSSTSVNCASTDLYQIDSSSDYDTLTGISGTGFSLYRQ